MHDIIWFDKLN